MQCAPKGRGIVYYVVWSLPRASETGITNVHAQFLYMSNTVKTRNSPLLKRIAIIIFSASALIFLVVILATNSDKADLERNKTIATQQLDSNRQSVAPKYSAEELQILADFQKSWADSIVKSWKGSFITDVYLKAPDSILFYLSKNASKNVESTRKHNKGVYEIMYENSIARLPEKLRSYPVFIDFLAAKGYKIENWIKFRTITYDGIVLYKGLSNEKEIYGSIIGGFIKEGNKFIEVLKGDGTVEVLERNFLNHKAFYYKANDPNVGKMIHWKTN